MIDNEKQLGAILQIMNEVGLLKDVILIGSWCLLFYKKVFENFIPLIRTTDVDFFVPNTKMIKGNSYLINSFHRENYDLSHDTLTNNTTFISPDGFEIEFLTKINRKGLSCVELGNTKIYAESISYVDFFTKNYIEVDYANLKLKIISPSAYVLQKLLINNRRGDKKEKDIESIKHVLSYINSSEKSKNELSALLSSLPKKWQRNILDTCKKNNVNLID